MSGWVATVADMREAQNSHRGRVRSILGQVSGISQWATAASVCGEKELLTAEGAEEFAEIAEELRRQTQHLAMGWQIWRRGWDLNPRYPLRYVRFRGGSFQPLTHLSETAAVSCQPSVPTTDERDAQLTSSPEEFLQNFSGSSCQNASANCHPMIRARMIDHGEQ